MSWGSSAEGTLLLERCAATISVTKGSSSVGFASSLIWRSHHFEVIKTLWIIGAGVYRARILFAAGVSNNETLRNTSPDTGPRLTPCAGEFLWTIRARSLRPQYADNS